MKMQIKDFTLTTYESMFDLPEVELKAKVLINSAPGDHIVNINSIAIKSILIQLLKQAIVLDSVQKVPASTQKPQEAQEEGK